jgi:hypothetical protein
LRAVFLAADFRAVRLFAGGTVTTFLLGCWVVDADDVRRRLLHGGLEAGTRRELHAL